MQITRIRRHAVLAAAVIGLLVASATLGYTVILKDGTQLEARNEFSVKDGVARVELINGNVISVPEEQIDFDKTRDFNARNLGTAVSIQGSKTVPHEPGLEPVRTLDDMLREREAAGLNARGIPQPQMPRTPSGYPDLTQLRRAAYNGGAADDLRKSLGDSGIEVVRFFQGTAPDRVLVEIQTSDEQAVFAALLATARAFEDVATDHSVKALELLMMTPGKKRAGQFEIDADAARVLSEGLLSPADFFMQFVQF